MTLSGPIMLIRNEAVAWLVQVAKSTNQNRETKIMVVYIFDVLLSFLVTKNDQTLLNGPFCCALSATSLIISSKLNETSGRFLNSESFKLFFRNDFIDTIELGSLKCLFDSKTSLNPSISLMSFISILLNSLDGILESVLYQNLTDNATELICQFIETDTVYMRYSRVVSAYAALLHSYRLLSVVIPDLSSWNLYIQHDNPSNYFNLKQCYRDFAQTPIIVTFEMTLINL